MPLENAVGFTRAISRVLRLLGAIMIHKLTDVRSNQQGFECLGALAMASEELFADELILDMTGVHVFDANMTAPLGVVLANIRDEFNTIKIININDEVGMALRRSSFFAHFQHDEASDNFDSTMPFRRFRLADQGLFEDYITRHLDAKEVSMMSSRAKKLFKMKAHEVYQNAVIHSESDAGIYVCGQMLPQRNWLNFTVSDAGIGIRESVRRYFCNDRIGSVKAIEWALKPSHTTKGGVHPGGLGLDFLKQFSVYNSGSIQISSRLGYYEFNDGKDIFKKMRVDLPGTSVTIGINTADTTHGKL